MLTRKVTKQNSIPHVPLVAGVLLIFDLQTISEQYLPLQRLYVILTRAQFHRDAQAENIAKQRFCQAERSRIPVPNCT